MGIFDTLVNALRNRDRKPKKLENPQYLRGLHAQAKRGTLTPDTTQRLQRSLANNPKVSQSLSQRIGTSIGKITGTGERKVPRPLSETVLGFGTGLEKGMAGFTGLEKPLGKKLGLAPQYKTSTGLGKTAEALGSMVGFALGPGKLVGPFESRIASKVPGLAGGSITSRISRKLVPAIAAESATSSIIAPTRSLITGEPLKKTFSEDVSAGLVGRGIFGAGAAGLPLMAGLAKTDAGESIVKAGKNVLPEPPKKLSVGGGEFSTQRFNTTDDLDKFIRETAEGIGDRIKKSRRGKVSWDDTFEDADKVTIAQILDRKRGQAVSDKYIAAASNHVKNLTESINALKQQAEGLEARGQSTEAIRKEMAQQVALYKAVVEQTFGASAEAGRALNVHKALAKQMETPQKQLVGKVLKQADEWGNVDRVVQDLMKFSEEDTVGMMKYLAEVKPSDPIKKIESTWYANILSSTGTHMANAFGNLGRTLWHLSSKPFRVGTDIATSKVTGQPRTEFMREMGPEVIGATKGFKDGVRRALFAMKHGFREGDISDLRIPDKPIKGRLGTFTSIPSRALVAGDELFRGISRSMEINKLAFKKAIDEGLEGTALTKRAGELAAAPTPSMVKRADDLAQELLFQKASSELRAAGGVRDMFAFDVPKIGKVKPLRFVVPFIQTPINVAKFGAEATPLGGASTLVQGSEKLGREEFNRRMGSAIMGTSVLTALAMYFSEDKIIGRAPRTKKERDAFYAQGKLPYSVKIGDQWVQFNRMPDPIATHLSLVSTMYDTFKETDREPTSTQIQSAVFSIMRSFADRTFLSGVADLMNAIEEPERYGGRFTRNLVSSLAVPASSLSRNIAKSMDRTVRKPESTIQSIQANIPGLSKRVPAVESEFEPGGEATRKSPAIQEFLPIKTSRELDTPESRFARSYELNLENKRKQRDAKEDIEKAVGGEGVDLSAYEPQTLAMAYYSILNSTDKPERRDKHLELSRTMDSKTEQKLSILIQMSDEGASTKDMDLLFIPEELRARAVVERLSDLKKENRKDKFLTLEKLGIITPQMIPVINDLIREMS